MAKVTVEFTAKFRQTIDWPDDELADLNYENLSINVNHADADAECTDVEILRVKLNGKEHHF